MKLRWIGLVLLLMVLGACQDSFRLNGSATILHEAGTPFTDPGFIALDDHVTLTGRVDPMIPGTYTLTYAWEHDDKTTTLTRTVKVLDRTPPTITLDGDLTQIVCPLAPYVESGVHVSDAVDSDIARRLRIRLEGNRVIYTATDASGNTATAVRTLQRQDLQAPVLSLKGYETMDVPLNTSFRDPGFRITDNCGDLSDRVVVEHNIDPTTVGDYTVTYTVTDDGGNTVTLTRDVTVIDEAETVVYLTFDDGPSLNTKTVLDVLADYGVKATFFVVKRSPRYDEYLIRAAGEGHTIGLHTYSHDYDRIYSSVNAYLSDLQQISDHVYSLTGIRSLILRFPGGSSNLISDFNPGIMTKVTAKVNALGYHYFDWNVSSGDGNSTNTAEFIAHRTILGIKRGRVNVVLLHDGGGSAETAEALPQILDYLVSINALILPITMETPVVQHDVQN
jgi:peptidoglycan/xylan/chitin deacetylase (PgdA/CDA1 family)